MLSYLPTAHECAGAAGLAATLLLFLALGGLAGSAAGGARAARRMLPETQLVAGWGAACIVFTLWGVLTPWSLRWPAAAMALAGAAWLLRPGWRDRVLPWRPLGWTLLLTAPLWAVMLSAWPSQIDTWLNLLPNAAFLADHDRLPTAALPASYSFLPVAPYNSQFANYLASLASGGFADGAMALFNVALLACAGLLLARALAGKPGAPPLWACAAGLLLAVPLNPGFVPRFFVSPYGEATLAVTALFAVWLAAELLDDLARGVAWPRSIAPLALVLAAMVNTKQSGSGLLAPIGAMLLVLAWIEPAIPRRRALAAIIAALAPSVALYLLWRGFVLRSGFPAGELKPLALADWNFGLLPRIILAILEEMFRKATFFLCLAALLALTVRVLRRAPWSPEGRLLILIAGAIILFNGFLLFTYIAHFPPEMALGAHSFFRYNTQISLLLMLGLVVTLRPWLVAWTAAWLAADPRRARRAGIGAVVAILLLPLAGAPLLRFDRDPPQPELRRLGHAVTPYLDRHDRLALLVPGDQNDSVGSFVRGVLLFTPPRRPGLDIRTEPSATPAVLSAVAAAGYRLALVTCAPPGLEGVPAGEAVLLEATGSGWRTLQAWPWPESMRRRRFAGMLTAAPLCG
ncbi:MAG: hypothetical protein WDN25_20325 [Acetobacteraceae bacterium]